MKFFASAAILVVLFLGFSAHAQHLPEVSEKETVFTVARGQLRVVEWRVNGVLDKVIAKDQEWPEESVFPCVTNGHSATCWSYSAPPKTPKDEVLYDRGTPKDTAAVSSPYLSGKIQHTVMAIAPIGHRKVIYVTDSWIWLYQRGIFEVVSLAGGNFEELECPGGDVCWFELGGSSERGNFHGVLFLKPDPDAWKMNGWSYPHEDSREPLETLERANYSDKAPKRAHPKSIRKLDIKDRNWYLITHKGDSPSQHLQTVLNADTGELWPQQF